MPTWNAIAAFSEECVAKLVHQMLLLYLVISSALERYSYWYSCKALLMQPLISDLNFGIDRFNNILWSITSSSLHAAKQNYSS